MKQESWMTTRSGVLVIGDTVLMEGVALSLMERRTVSVDRINPKETDVWTCVTMTNPDVIVFEIGCPQSLVILSLMHEMPGMQLLGVDMQGDRVIVMNSRSYTARSMLELHRVFESILSSGAHKPRSWTGESEDQGKSLHTRKQVK
jgi:hypothetical protein